MTRFARSALSNRSLLKTVTYGAMHLTVAVLVAFALTRSLAIALSIGLVEPFVQTFFYNLHERLWQRFGGTPRGAGHGQHHHGPVLPA